ncbi:MAG TPA: LysM domain-containing protein [Actinomycetota bacterium]|nr:LysM domain-containing protein [Actinomycetota bacterium]
MATISASPEMVSPRPASWVRPRLPQRPEVAARPTSGSSATHDASLEVTRRLPMLLAAAFGLTLLLSALLPRVMVSLRAPDPRPAAAVPPVESAAHPAWTVEGGQTLWGIAAAVEPGVDPRRTVQRLRDLNGLPAGHMLQVGEVLLLPATG